MKLKACCWKWKQIGCCDYTITFPMSGDNIDFHNENVDKVTYDKRKIRFCPECGTCLLNIIEGLKRLGL